VLNWGKYVGGFEFLGIEILIYVLVQSDGKLSLIGVL